MMGLEAEEKELTKQRRDIVKERNSLKITCPSANRYHRQFHYRSR